MIYSMTGYGQVTEVLDGVSYSAEIRTVNNRYFKVNTRVPESVSFLEDTIEKFLRNKFSRGMVNFNLRLKNLACSDLLEVNSLALENYISQFKAAKIDCGKDVKMADLINLPGVLVAPEPDEEQAEQIRQDCLKVVAMTVEKVCQMRAEEGKALVADMLKHCNVIAEKLTIVEGRIDIVIEEYHEKLKKRIDHLLSTAKLDIDQDLLAREVAIFADRSDISEEIARLKSHLSQFSDSCNNSGSAGKKLDFIAQEMLREANTIASKASDSLIIECVVDIKCGIDRIKEQVQNVE